MVALTEKQAYWKTHLEAARSFGGSLVDYARAHDLSAKKSYVNKTGEHIERWLERIPFHGLRDQHQKPVDLLPATP